MFPPHFKAMRIKGFKQGASTSHNSEKKHTKEGRKYLSKISPFKLEWSQTCKWPETSVKGWACAEVTPSTPCLRHPILPWRRATAWAQHSP